MTQTVKTGELTPESGYIVGCTCVNCYRYRSGMIIGEKFGKQ